MKVLFYYTAAEFVDSILKDVYKIENQLTSEVYFENDNVK